MTKVTLHIETEDAGLVERIGHVLNGGRAVAATPEPPGDSDSSERTEAPKPQPEPDANTAGNGPAEPASTAGGNTTAPGAAEQAPAGVDVDVDGLPWDERIHASTKTKTADGRWKKKRGVSDDVKAQVENELHALMAIPGGGEPAPEKTAAETFQQPTETPQPEPAAGAPSTFMDLVGEIGKRGIGQDAINHALGLCNPPLPSFQALANRPDLIPAFWEQLTGA